jgi:hypothetical protein
MARRRGSGKRWLALAAAAAAFSGAAQDPAEPEPARPAEAGPRAHAQHEKAAPASAAPAPATELLDYLGRYADAADGIDPLGLAAASAETPESDAPPRKRP